MAHTAASTPVQRSPGARPNRRRNTDAFADACGGLDSPRALGVIVTNRIPSRYIQGSLWD